MKKDRIIFVFLLLVLIILIPAVYSAEDFTAGSKHADLDICVLSGHQEFVEIRNTGSTYSEYVIWLEGNAADFATVLPEKLALMPGKNASVRIDYLFPKDKTGKYTLELNIKSNIGGKNNLGLHKKLVQRINSKLCNNNLLLAYNFNQTACPCLEMIYNFTVTNIGSYPEFYTFGIDRFAEYANISRNNIVLLPGEKGDVRLFFNVKCDIYGEYVVNFFSRARNSGISAKIPLLLNIRKCYDYDIKTGNAYENNDSKFYEEFSERESSYELCSGYNKSVQIMINNVGYIGNNFDYNVEGPEWGSVYGDVLRLSAYEKGYTYLDLTPPTKAIGDYKFVFDVRPNIGDMKKQKVINVHLSDCYGLIVDMPPDRRFCNCIDSSFDVSVMNTGKFREIVNISAEAPDFINLSMNVVNIGSGDSKRLSITAKPGCDVKGKSNLRVKAELENRKAYAEDIMNIEIVPIEECYDITISMQESISLNYEREIIPVSIYHNGLKKANYKIEIDGEKWLKPGVDIFSISPGERYSFYLFAEPTIDVAEAVYYATLNIKSGDVAYRKHLKLRLRKNEPMLDSLLHYADYYRYWVYTSVAILILIVFLYFYFRERARNWGVRNLIRRAIKNEKERKNEARKGDEKVEEEVEYSAEKEQKGKKKKEKKSFKWFFIFFFVALVAGAICYSIYYYFNTIYSAFMSAWLFVVEYRFFLFIGLLLLGIVIFILNRFEKKLKV